MDGEEDAAAWLAGVYAGQQFNRIMVDDWTQGSLPNGQSLY